MLFLFCWLGKWGKGKRLIEADMLGIVESSLRGGMIRLLWIGPRERGREILGEQREYRRNVSERDRG